MGNYPRAVNSGELLLHPGPKGSGREWYCKIVLQAIEEHSSLLLPSGVLLVLGTGQTQLEGAESKGGWKMQTTEVRLSKSRVVGMGLHWGWGAQRITVIPTSHGKLFSQCACPCLFQTNNLCPKNTRILMITKII